MFENGFVSLDGVIIMNYCFGDGENYNFLVLVFSECDMYVGVLSGLN